MQKKFTPNLFSISKGSKYRRKRRFLLRTNGRILLGGLHIHIYPQKTGKKKDKEKNANPKSGPKGAVHAVRDILL